MSDGDPREKEPCRHCEEAPAHRDGRGLCLDCAEGLAERAYERLCADFYGGSSPTTSEEVYQAAAKLKREVG